MKKRLLAITVSFAFLIQFLSGCNAKIHTSITSADDSSIADDSSSDTQTSQSSSKRKTISVNMPGADSISKYYYGDYHSLLFINKNIGYVAASFDTNCDILQTTDGGNTWNPIYSDKSNTIDKVVFVNQSVGWMIAHNKADYPSTVYKIYRTDDGGKTFYIQWTAGSGAEISTVFYPSLYLKFLDSSNGYAAVADTLMKTSDGGKTWKELSALPGDFKLSSVYFVSKDGGWISGYKNQANGQSGTSVVYKTADGGKSWIKQFEQKDDCDPYRVVAMDFINKNTGWFVIGNFDGTPGFMYQTTNGGASFTMINHSISVMRPYVTDTDFLNAKEGWISTAQGAGGAENIGLLHTSDGGKTFDQNYANIAQMHDMNEILFTTAETGFAIGKNQYLGCILHTDDGGKNWSQISIALPTGINFVDTQNGFAISSQQEPNVLLRTSDGGKSWSIVYEFGKNDQYYYQSFDSISFIDKNIGFAIKGCYGNDLQTEDFMKTVDGGKSWTALYSFSQNGAEYLKMFDTKNGVYISYSAVINHYYQTNDGGVTWQEVPSAFSNDYFKVTMGSMNTGLYSDDLSQTVSSLNDNALTKTLQLPDSYTVSSMDMKDNKAIVLCSDYKLDHCMIAVSDDAGETWSTADLSADAYAYLMKSSGSPAITILNPNEAYILAPNYGLLYTSDGGASWIWK